MDASAPGTPPSDPTQAFEKHGGNDEDLNGGEASKPVEELSTSELWDQVGFHRPLAGFFYEIAFFLIIIVFSAVFTAYLWGFLYPFPESMGYRTAATGIFALFFQAFDLGTANIMNRFIGENNIKNPLKMVQYVQYFIWYQMITGLIQTTTVSLYALYFVPRGELIYAIWIMLIFSTTQYPGFLGVFRNVLGTLQQFHRTAVLNFISGELFQRVTEIIFVIWGRWWGAQNPAIGEIMGIAIGATIGYYVDDFFATALSAYYFSKTMGNYNLTVKECFRHDFDRDLFKECLVWGVKTGMPGIVWAGVSLVSLYLWLWYVPQYTTFVTFASLAGTFGSLVSRQINLGGAISEAFFNDKKRLAKYYIGQVFRYTGLLQVMLFFIMLLVIEVLPGLFQVTGLTLYLLAIPFIFPKMIRELQQPWNNLSENIIYSTGHINFQMFMKFFEAGIMLVSWFVFIVWLQIPQRYGIVAIAWLIPCGEMVAICAKVAINYIFIQRRIMRLELPYWQTFVAPALSALVIWGIGMLYLNFVYEPMYAALGFWVAFVPAVLVVVIVLPIVLYMPLTAFFGGWDDGSIQVLHKATQMSGPGKFISMPIYKSVQAAARHSSLHNKHAMDDTEALEEARELVEIRAEKLREQEEQDQERTQ